MRISDWSSDVCSSDLDDEELEFRRAEPVGGLLERGLHRAADLHLVGHRLELDGHWARNLGGDDAHRLRNGKAGPKAAHHQLDSVREPRGELGDTALDEHADNEMREIGRANVCTTVKNE